MCFGKPHRDDRAQIVADEAVNCLPERSTSRGRVSQEACRGAFGRQPARKSDFIPLHCLPPAVYSFALLEFEQ
jgi:hypothetical protein